MARIGLAAFAVFSCLPLIANACSVPVFRFALEQWATSNYELLVFANGPLSVEDRKMLAQIKQSSRQSNLVIREVRVDAQMRKEFQAIWAAEGKSPALPRLVLRFPDSKPEVPSAWSGPIKGLIAERLIHSPARQAIYDQLTAGNAAVIVLLLSGDSAADEAARKVLRVQLPRLAERTELPAKTEEGPQVQSIVPLHVRFPLIEVERGDQEAMLVRMLVGSEDALDKVRGPIAFPVFGRGRALCSLHGSDLSNPEQLQRSLDFLCHACSCQAKELNPGIDLLIAGDWEIIFSAEHGPTPRVIDSGEVVPVEKRDSGKSGVNSAEVRSPPPPGYSTVESDSESATRPAWRRFGIAGAAVCLLFAGFWALRGRQPIPPGQP